MKALNFFFGVLILAASLAASPVAAASVLATLAGLALVGSPALPGMATAPTVPPAPVVRVVQVPEQLRVFELEGGGGVVVFRTVNGKLVSRMYRA
jgi:hypothetical protein